MGLLSRSLWVRFLAHRTGPVDRWIARQYRASFAALGRQARHDASDRVRNEPALGARPALHHCGRNLRRSAHGQDSLHSAGEYRCEEMMVASTVSMTALVSVISLMIWLYGLIRASNTHRCQIRAGSGQTSLRVPPDEGCPAIAHELLWRVGKRVIANSRIISIWTNYRLLPVRICRSFPAATHPYEVTVEKTISSMSSARIRTSIPFFL
jgi:hypothetical protein